MHDVAHLVGTVKRLDPSARVYLAGGPRPSKTERPANESSVLLDSRRGRVEKPLRLRIGQYGLSLIEHICVSVIRCPAELVRKSDSAIADLVAYCFGETMEICRLEVNKEFVLANSERA